MTHFHADHIGAAAELAAHSGAAVLAHRWDAPVIRGDMPAPQPVLTAEERPLHERITAAGRRPPPRPAGSTVSSPRVTCSTWEAGRP